jgi:hypothetical protein
LEIKIIENQKLGKGIRLTARELSVSPAGVIKVLKRNGLYLKKLKLKKDIPLNDKSN